MTQDEIIRVAQEAGFVIWSDTSRKGLVDWACEYDTELERFAALVAEPWIETNKALANEIIELQKQAEQEPVALIEECRDALAQELMAYDIDPPIHHVKQAHDKCVAWLSNYASPVRTKDLTDEEEHELAKSSVGKSRHWLVAAAIAAYKEKNK